MLSNSADFIPAGALERRAAAILRLGVRLILKPAFSPRVPMSWQRWWLRQMAHISWLPNGVDYQAGKAGGVPGEWVRPRRLAPAKKAAILYLHGGAYCVGAPATHRAVTAHLCRAANLPVFAADYRLAPEHPFPAALDDAVAAYKSLAGQGPVIIAGDSAGGGLALATALCLRQQNVTPPAVLVLFSPWTDLTPSAHSDKDVGCDVMLNPAWLNACARHYLAGSNAAAPLASPLFGQFSGLPPTLIQAGADELLRGEAVKLHDALDRAGVAVTCEIVPGRWHAFQIHAGLLPSAHAAIKRAGRFIAANLPA